jgi:modification target Cys-rich repeat protein
MASCEADATLVCTGTAPDFQCSGSCEGSCELMAAAECTGTCRGTCNGTCSVMASNGTDCAGECMGDCQGTCELSAGGTCMGDCTGSCTYEPGMAGCEADASAKCEAMAGGTIECDAGCEGEVTPPSVSAECEATVEAKADASIECFPPSLEVTWQWSAALEGDVMAQAEFKAWLQGFKGHIGVMLAAKTKADILIESIGNLGAAAEGALSASFEGLVEGDFVASFKVVTCAIPQLGDAADLLSGASGSLSAEASASAEVFTAVGM